MTSNNLRFHDQYCVFRASGMTWAVSATSVREVTDIVPVVIVPDSSGVLLGICHLRNDFLPVLDLQSFLGESNQSTAADNVLLILDSTTGPWGIPIERAIGLESLEVAIGEAVEHGSPSSGATLGTATFRDEIVRVIDARRMYHLAVEELEQRWKGSRRTSHESVMPVNNASIEKAIE